MAWRAISRPLFKLHRRPDSRAAPGKSGLHARGEGVKSLTQLQAEGSWSSSHQRLNRAYTTHEGTGHPLEEVLKESPGRKVSSASQELESITTNKASGGDGIPVELFQILKDEAVKVLHSINQQI